MMNISYPALGVLALAASCASAGPAACGVCQTGCAAVVMACYSAAGYTWGVALGAGVPATILACNSAFGTCQSACAAVILAPLFWASKACRPSDRPVLFLVTFCKSCWTVAVVSLKIHEEVKCPWYPLLRKWPIDAGV
ncbi:uncharacterized protein BO66DRAFT_445109 [Aspergillus aculeatinus CBS 121060]|uniref:Uncharacterized protein n=1 Tax=Aspergillus aculeatinus CBS 121060 TaxID=1448322 RepID=A0ACD1HPJ4_9EURO|nr:hypothetical protein BO66DRAFT_445109 [Aspergillus aculeatinus CBS 121060]RAH75391.1 hypothetical protein BO66DRAFT_445109 [Aspergillus aculeatinus CBS 121060]